MEELDPDKGSDVMCPDITQHFSYMLSVMGVALPPLLRAG